MKEVMIFVLAVLPLSVISIAAIAGFVKGIYDIMKDDHSKQN